MLAKRMVCIVVEKKKGDVVGLVDRKVYLHDEVAAEGADAGDTDARFRCAVCGSYTCCIPSHQRSPSSYRVLCRARLLHPKIMANATPPMPRKGANLGARSGVSAMLMVAILSRRRRWRVNVVA